MVRKSREFNRGEVYKELVNVKKGDKQYNHDIMMSFTGPRPFPKNGPMTIDVISAFALETRQRIEAHRKLLEALEKYLQSLK